ncbi:hypothetical protein KR51_00020790 [Rubidibacter lacunae KORDI 51-2]|uniref:DUF5615 domain-containing protein n=1 Tax=Rubidibacter lacunae KORDI 51-2 TaxID=582515 RepID=U5DP67_9CHRO|nr:DUF5615 family PIN-like protein [Rubidibacter lacunae]ERN41500.1 hypothetical protein KR51_00020790 [Rubidibacter lacunae KORDI 51-2]
MKFLADENFDNAIARGLRQRLPEIDLVRVQDVGLSGLNDQTILAWAAAENRVLLTHNVRTITRYAYERLLKDLPMAGVIEVRQSAAIGKAIAD